MQKDANKPKRLNWKLHLSFCVFFLAWRDWWPHTADHSGCFGHGSVCGVDSTEGQTRSDHPALRPGWRRGAADHLPPPAYTQPVLPASKQRGCERVQTCVCVCMRERNESSCSLTDLITLTRCMSSPAIWRWTIHSSWLVPFVSPWEVVCSANLLEACHAHFYCKCSVPHVYVLVERLTAVKRILYRPQPHRSAVNISKKIHRFLCMLACMCSPMEKI